MDILTSDGKVKVEKGVFSKVLIEGYYFMLVTHRPYSGKQRFDNKCWNCTEFKTGLAISSYATTKKNALDQAIDNIRKRAGGVKACVERINSLETINGDKEAM